MLYPQRIQVIQWLGVCTILVFLMVILGGAVRVTGSGLSMVDWRPLLGAIPPIGEAAWLEVFREYQRSPEGQLVNAHFSLGEFQFIYYMEYLHRLLGRFVGLVFFVPLCYFLWRGGLSRRLQSRLWFVFLLGAVQGLLGWYMVKSGLVDDPRVSQYRLVAHLLLAVVIYVAMIRLMVGLWLGRNGPNVAGGKPDFLSASSVALALVLIMIASGGFMAGTHAGHIYNTWPTMGDDWFPEMFLGMQPWWRNLFENTVTIQFIHRWLAIVVAVVVIMFVLRVRRWDERPLSRRLASYTVGLVVLQVMLGISTLVSGVPAVLAVAHQGTGLLLIGALAAIWGGYLEPYSSSGRV